MVRHCFIGTEGQHDQAVVGRILLHLGLKEFNSGDEFDSFWDPFRPKPGSFYRPMQFPSLFSNNERSVLVYRGEGSGLAKSISAYFSAHALQRRALHSLAVVADADNRNIQNVSKEYHDQLKG
ncbi:MAG: hypothetical protein K2X81_24660, partial [Candidatus Obscuribacterales bacterium]|nr:hypothetical protein [Candidatus Obscuribacterales bacterium]